MATQDRVKRERLKKLLDKGMVMIHLDARRPGVSVPGQFAGEPHLRLNLNYKFAPYDLELGDAQVRATLTFAGTPWLCLVPYRAIFGLTSQSLVESLVWLEDVPEEELASLVSIGRTAAQPVALHCRTEPEPVAEPQLSTAVGGEVRRGHLRLIK